MSGKRQHYIPRFLQSGFAVPGPQSRPQVWVFHRDHGFYRTNITNAGVQGWFYTDDDDHDADTVITSVEGEYADLVADLRSHSGSALRSPLIPQMLTHFEVRTRQFRQNMAILGERGIGGFLDLLQGKSGTDRLITYMLANPELLQDELRKRNLPPQLAKVIEPLMLEEIKRTQVERDEALGRFRPQVGTEMSKIAKTAHVRALRTSASPPKRAQRLSGLNYEVLRIERTQLILGDAIVLFRLDGPKPYRNVLQGGDGLLNVYLPLSPSAILVGSQEGPAVLPPDINRELARCSLECFIASEDSAENRRLRSQIGRNAEFLENEEIAGIVEEAFPLGTQLPE